MFLSVTIGCFAMSYGIALALEIVRFWFQHAARGAIMLAFAGLGFVTHTLFLIARAIRENPQAAPLSSWFDWFLLAAWLLAAFYLYLTIYHWRTAMGLFVLPVVLGLVGVATFFASRENFPQSEARTIWGRIHGGALLLGTVAVSLGCIAGLMYLVQAYRLKKKLPAFPGFRLPSLEWLERTNIRALVISAILLGAGVISGVILNIIQRANEQAVALPWSDPAVWSSAMLFAWLVAVLIFNMVYRPARGGRKVAYLTVASFVFLAMVFAVLLFVPTKHGAEKSDGGKTKLPTVAIVVFRSAKGRSFAERKTTIIYVPTLTQTSVSNTTDPGAIV